MNISVIGSGYVGLVTAACFADLGNKVICLDNNVKKINDLKKGILPIYEPGLDEIINRCLHDNRIIFTTDPKECISFSQYQFIAVGTPQGDNGNADLKYVFSVAETISKLMDDYKIIIDKSTVPVGTASKVRDIVSKNLKMRNLNIKFSVVSNPEFLKEGSAISDFQNPDRIIIGSDDKKSSDLMKKLYQPKLRKHDRLIFMDVKSAELTKYAANSMLATRISFMNEISRFAEKVGADIDKVRIGIGSDQRIGYNFLYPGCGYGGSCFPKDLRALIYNAKDYGVDLSLLKTVEDINNDQKKILIHKITKYFGKKLNKFTFALWGLSFKPNTDDMREAPSLVIINNLLNMGAKIKAYDPIATDEAKKIINSKNISFYNNMYKVLNNCDALIIVTEWKEFRYPDFNKVTMLLNNAIIFDGRNLYNTTEIKDKKIKYFSIGRN